MRRRSGSAAVLLIALVTACTTTTSGRGSSSVTPSGSASGFPSAPSSVPTSAPGGSAAPTGAPTQAALAKVVVQQSDLPTGWTGKPASGGASPDTDLQAQLLRCIGGKIDESQRVAHVDGDEFSQGQLTISSDATSYKTQAEVDNRSSIISSPRAGTCLNQIVRELLQRQLPAGTTLNGVALALTGGSNGGPPNVVATEKGKITVTSQGQSATVYLDAAFIRGRQLTATVEFEGIGGPVDANLQATVVAAVAARAARA